MADEIITERLRLRRATMDDLAAIHGLLSDPRNMRFWSSPPHESLAQSETWLRSMVEAKPGLSDDYVVEHRGRAIGKAGAANAGLLAARIIGSHDAEMRERLKAYTARMAEDALRPEPAEGPR